LFGAAVEAAPNSSYTWHFLGVVLMKDRRFDEAAVAFGRSIDGGHPLPADRMLKLRALVLAGNSAEGLQWAEGGPKDELSADMIAWWARAAFNVGDRGRAASLLEMLKTPRGYDGPPWVNPLAKQVLNHPTE
jgi:Flp pilus assembly protein TadD